MCKEPPTARARGPRDQDIPRRGEPGFGVVVVVVVVSHIQRIGCQPGKNYTVTRSEREPHGTCQRAGNITGSVYSARGALVHQVPPAEEPTKSTAKKRQCDRRHRSEERNYGATTASATEGWPGRDYYSSLNNSWGIYHQILKEYCRAHCPDANDRERSK